MSPYSVLFALLVASSSLSSSAAWVTFSPDGVYDDETRELILEYNTGLMLSEQRGKSSGWYCRGGDSCCQPYDDSERCGFSEGDCDDDEDCLGPLVCGSYNCKDILEDGTGVGLVGTTADDWDWDDDCCTFREPILEMLSYNFKFGESK